MLLHGFLPLRIIDIIDIAVLAYCLYQLYKTTRDTVAYYIFLSILALFAIRMIVKPLDMNLLGTILDQFFSIGAIAMVVIFQPEIRKFLTRLGTKYGKMKPHWKLMDLFRRTGNDTMDEKFDYGILVNACASMSRTKTGALIVIPRKNPLTDYSETGDIIDARPSERLIENIFFKNSPLHDGAMILQQEYIHAARCILPVSANPDIPANLGLRHRAAIGLTEVTDALAVIVSEETGNISLADGGVVLENIGADKLREMLEELG